MTADEAAVIIGEAIHSEIETALRPSARPDRWPTATSVQFPKKVYRGLFLLAAAWVLLWLAFQAYFLAAVFGLVAALALCGWTSALGFIDGYRHGLSDAAEDAVTAASEAAREVDFSRHGYRPAAHAVEGYLYVIRFSTAVIKVGQTCDPPRRIFEHRSDARAFGVVITRLWVSDPHEAYLANEVELLSFACSRAERARREYFHGANFDEVVAFANSLVGRAAHADLI